jgi:hypothetical protein
VAPKLHAKSRFLAFSDPEKNTEMASSNVNVTMLAFCVVFALSVLHTDGSISYEFSFSNLFLSRNKNALETDRFYLLT